MIPQRGHPFEIENTIAASHRLCLQPRWSLVGIDGRRGSDNSDLECGYRREDQSHIASITDTSEASVFIRWNDPSRIHGCRDRFLLDLSAAHVGSQLGKIPRNHSYPGQQYAPCHVRVSPSGKLAALYSGHRIDLYEPKDHRFRERWSLLVPIRSREESSLMKPRESSIS